MDDISVTLTASEYEIVTRQIVGDGGHQRLLRKMLAYLNHDTRNITLIATHLAKARVYANRYGGGGYQDRFLALIAAAERWQE